VVEACAKGQFRIYAVASIDEGLEILTGLEAGVADDKGQYPLGSINRAVTAKLAASAKKARAFTQPAQPQGNSKRKR